MLVRLPRGDDNWEGDSNPDEPRSTKSAGTVRPISNNANFGRVMKERVEQARKTGYPNPIRTLMLAFRELVVHTRRRRFLRMFRSILNPP